MMNSSVFDNPDLFRMWVWCLLKASHVGYKQMVGLEEIYVKEGQFITGRSKGSAELNVNPNTWYSHIRVLERMGMIELNSNNKRTIVSIVNWAFYQGEDSERQQQNNNKITTKEQQNNTNKNDKNVKNVKNINKCEQKTKKFEEDSIEYLLANHLYQRIKQNDSKTKKPNLQNWSVHVDRLIRLDERPPKEIKQVIEWATNDDFWRANILSTSKLRQQYQTLKLQMQRNNRPKNSVSYDEQNRQAIKEFLSEF